MRDAALVLRAIAGHDPRDPASADAPAPDYAAALTRDVRGLVLGVPCDWLDRELPPSPASCVALDAALDVLRGLGATVRPVVLPPIRAFHATLKVIAACELFAMHARDLRARPEGFGQSLRYRVIAGGLVRAEEYLLAGRARTDLARATQDVMAEVDAIALPTAGPAPPLRPVDPATNFTLPSYTGPFSVSGNPALSLLAGFDADGMPLSLQIVGRLFDEATVLRLGDAYEAAAGWHASPPDAPWRRPAPAVASGVPPV